MQRAAGILPAEEIQELNGMMNNLAETNPPGDADGALKHYFFGGSPFASWFVPADGACGAGRSNC
jgi:hypothetical protein